MKDIQRKQDGFSAVEVLLVLVVIGVVVFAVLNVVSRQDTASDDSNAPATTQDEIETTQDLQEVEDALTETDLETLDTTELDAAEADLL